MAQGPTKDYRDPKFFELWCNGNTSDFGSEIIGSNPVSPTKKVFGLLIQFVLGHSITVITADSKSVAP